MLKLFHFVLAVSFLLYVEARSADKLPGLCTHWYLNPTVRPDIVNNEDLVCFCTEPFNGTLLNNSLQKIVDDLR